MSVEVVFAPVAVALDRAAEMAGVSVDTIEKAIRTHQLIAHYPTRKPLVLVDDLRAWITSAPTKYGGT